MRAFLAIDIPEALKGDLVRLQNELRIGRRVAPENLHLTLTFLGDVSEDVAEELVDQLTAMRPAAPEIALKGVGHFGGDRPRQVWAGVAETAALTTLAGRLAGTARSLGLEIERRRFTPHVTLTRLSGHPGDAGAVAAFEAAHSLFAAAFQPYAITLFRSELRPGGTQYEALAAVPMAVG